MLTASGDKTCKLWDIETSQVVTYVYFAGMGSGKGSVRQNALLCCREFVMGDQVLDQQVGCLWQGSYLLSVSLSGYINYLDVNDPSKPLRVLRVSSVPLFGVP